MPSKYKYYHFCQLRTLCCYCSVWSYSK